MNCLPKLAAANLGRRGARSRETGDVVAAFLFLAGAVLTTLPVPTQAVAAEPSVGSSRSLKISNMPSMVVLRHS
jgi:hypothetical protein